MYSLRSQGWTPFEQLDFCSRWGLEIVHFSEPRQIGGLDPDHLDRVAGHAAALGIQIELGMLSICPGASIFDRASGSAEDQIATMLAAARRVGSPILRCVVGRFTDRRSQGGIEQRIEETVAVLRSVRSRVIDAGLMVAVENHAGDMQARELKMLVEEAGRDFVGVCVDAGNALWAMEDPHLTLDTLAPYVLTSHTRDSRVWSVPEGAAVAWVRMGHGNVRIGEYLRTFVERCPGRPLSLEIIVKTDPMILAYREPAFWHAYRRMPAWEFVRFLALLPVDDEVDGDVGVGEARDARAVPARPPSPQNELEDVEASLRWTREFFGLV
jgi:3-oxoisoapionate decarboxylase